MGKVLLSFDIEEFEVPEEYHGTMRKEDVFATSAQGASVILDIMKENGVKATFFCTGRFAEEESELVRRMVDEGHEVASHGYRHNRRQRNDDILKSKQVLEGITGKAVNGYREPKMFDVDNAFLARQGMAYNSSLNPAFIPGRYMHLDTPRTWFWQDGVAQIPASVTPWLRLPMFWLGLHNYPLALYLALCKRCIKHDGYFVTYLHPWEFTALDSHPEYRLPWIIRHNCGERLRRRLDSVIKELKKEGHEFVCFSNFANSIK